MLKLAIKAGCKSASDLARFYANIKLNPNYIIGLNC